MVFQPASEDDTRTKATPTLKEDIKEDPFDFSKPKLLTFDEMANMTTIGKNVEFLDRTNSIAEKNINIIFKCKQKCKTIFTNEYIREMLRFTRQATDDPLWNMLCYRQTPDRVVFVADQ